MRIIPRNEFFVESHIASLGRRFFVSCMSAIAAIGISQKTVYALGIRRLSFSSNGPVNSSSSRIVSNVSGYADLHQETGRIHFVYLANVDLYIGNQKWGPCETPIKIHFKLLNERKQILESFGDIYAQNGSNEKVFAVSQEMLSQTKRVVASITG